MTRRVPSVVGPVVLSRDDIHDLPCDARVQIAVVQGVVLGFVCGVLLGVVLYGP